jgi:hypothetical protein
MKVIDQDQCWAQSVSGGDEESELTVIAKALGCKRLSEANDIRVSHSPPSIHGAERRFVDQFISFDPAQDVHVPIYLTPCPISRRGMKIDATAWMTVRLHTRGHSRVIEWGQGVIYAHLLGKAGIRAGWRKPLSIVTCGQEPPEVVGNEEGVQVLRGDWRSGQRCQRGSIEVVIELRCQGEATLAMIPLTGGLTCC